MRNRWIRGAVITALAAAVAVTATGWSGHQNGVAGSLKPTASNAGIKGSIVFDGVWTSSSGQKQFQDVINAFNKKYPNVKVNYHPIGDSLPTVLATAVAGGHPPDMADIAQPGTVQQFATQGKLKPITYATGTINANYLPAWRKLGTFNGKLYALVFKAANKSLVWYNVPAFKTAGVNPPKTWTQLLADAKTIKRRARPRTRSAAPTAGRSPTCSRTSTSGRSGRRSTRLCPRTRSSGLTRRSPPR